MFFTKSSWTGRAGISTCRKANSFSEAFLAVNPRAIVPVLDHDGRLIHESSVICEYLDGLSAHNPLMPDDPVARARTRTWGVYTLEYHDSVNTLTFSSYQRRMLLAKPAEELEARWRSIPDPIKARKLQDLVANGVQSDYVPAALASWHGCAPKWMRPCPADHG